MADDAPHSSTFIAKPPKLQRIMETPAAQSLLAGGVAGIISRTTVAPLERVKILFQVQALSAQGAPLKHTTVLRSLIDMYRAGGIIGMWKGNTANCVRVFPSSALQFARSSAWRSMTIRRRRSASSPAAAPAPSRAS